VRLHQQRADRVDALHHLPDALDHADGELHVELHDLVEGPRHHPEEPGRVGVADARRELVERVPGGAEVAVVVAPGVVGVGLDGLDLGANVVGDVAVGQPQGVDALAAPLDARLAVGQPRGQGVEPRGRRSHRGLGVLDVAGLGVLVDLGPEGVEAGALPRRAVADLRELAGRGPGGAQLAGQQPQVGGAAADGGRVAVETGDVVGRSREVVTEEAQS
jgi:hypothetical protein